MVVTEHGGDEQGINDNELILYGDGGMNGNAHPPPPALILDDDNDDNDSILVL